ERCTALYGVPTMFIAQLAQPDFDRYELSTLRTGIMAGSPCPVEVMKKVQSLMHMPEVTICYGMTETSRSEEHTSELQSRGHLVDLPSFPTRRSSDLGTMYRTLRRADHVHRPACATGFRSLRAVDAPHRHHGRLAVSSGSDEEGAVADAHA